MKKTIAAIVCACAVATTASARDPWVTQTGLSSSQLSSRVVTFETPGYGLQIEQVSGYEEYGSIYYAGLWGPRTDSAERRTYVGMTTSQFISTNASIQGAGWRICWLNGFYSGGTNYYNAIYHKTNGAAQVLRVGDTLADHQSADSALRADNHYLEKVTAFGSSGFNVVYAAVWNQFSRIAPTYEITYGLTTAGLTSEVNSRINTWRIHDICGYSPPFVVGGGDPHRFTVIWRQPKLSTAWGFLPGLVKTNYFAADSNNVGIGWRPSFLQGWKDGSDVVFNAMWIPNGGLDGTYINQIDSLVQSAMSSQEIPGFSLAISRNGRLMFKRAYGLADKESGEWAGTDHRFRIASVSKAVTGVSVLHALENQSTWNINSKVFGTGAVFGNDYGTPPYSAREMDISISNLLHHTAGWSGDGKLWYYQEPSWGSSHQEFIDWQLDNGTFVADPGDIGRYSNLGFTIAARVVEKLSGETFEGYTRSHIFADCGISAILGPVVGERTRAQKKLFEVAYYPNTNNPDDPYLIDPRRMDGSTAWIARPADLLLFGRRVDGDDDFWDIINPNTFSTLHTRETPSSSTGYTWQNYGCGWFTDNYFVPAFWGHNGSMAGSRADLVARTNGISYAWAANAQGAISSDSMVFILNGITAADAWPDIDLFGIHHPAYDSWLGNYFSGVVRGSPGLEEQVLAPNADPDGDELPNAAELILGLDPSVANGSPFTVTRSGESMRIRWLVKSGIDGVTMTYRASTDLKNWLGLIGIPITSPGGFAPLGYSWRQLDIPMTGTQRFIRFEYKVR